MVEAYVNQAFDEIGRALKEKGITLEELMVRGREIRGEIIEKEYGVNDTRERD